MGEMLQLLRLSLPYPVIQLWNELEDGQMVKFPAYDEKYGEVILHAQRDGNERMEVEIDRLSLRGLENAYSAEINIFSVKQSAADTTIETVPKAEKIPSPKSQIKNGHADDKEEKGSNGPKVLGTITQISTLSPEGGKSSKRKTAKPMRVKHLGEENFEYQIIKNEPEYIQVTDLAPIKVEPTIDKVEVKTESTPSVTTPVLSSTNEICENSFDGSESTGNGKITKSYSPQNFERINKKGRGPPQYMCYLCEMRFVYLRSFQKHMDRHGVSAKDVLQAINAQRSQSFVMENTTPNSQFQSTSTPTSAADRESVSNSNSAFPELSGTDEAGVPIYEIRPNPAFLDKSYNEAPSPSFDVDAGTSGSSSLVYESSSANQQNMEADIPVSEMLGTIHISPEGPYTCKMCSRAFQYRTPFIRHINQEHRLKVVMDESDSSTKTPKRGKTLTCPVCASKFCYQGPFAKHMHERHGMGGVEIQNLVQALMRGDDPQSALEMASLPTNVQFSIAASNAKQQSQQFDSSSTSFQQIDSLLDGFNSSDNRKSPGASAVSDSNEANPFMANKVYTLSKSDEDYLLTDSETGQDINLGATCCCHLCRRVFTYRSSFIKHLRWDHSMNVMDGCDTRPNRRTGKTFPCHLCSKTFMYRIPYQKHMETAHDLPLHGLDKRKSDFWCRLCQKRFSYKLSYRKHLRSDHGLDPDLLSSANAASMYHCEECQAKFTYAEALEIHKARRHSGTSGTSLPPRIKSVMEDIASWQEQSQMCEEYVTLDGSDEDTFQSSAKLEGADNAPSMIKCKLCDKTFRYNMAFRKHMKKVHPDVADYSSSNNSTPKKSEVGSTSKPSPRLQRHNSGGKIHGLLYGCSLCPFRSSYVRTVQNHVQGCHLVGTKEAAVVLLQRSSINAKLVALARKKSHICYECAQGFMRKSLLLLHRMRRHRKQPIKLQRPIKLPPGGNKNKRSLSSKMTLGVKK